MTIRQRTQGLQIPLTSEDFPPGILRNGQDHLSVCWEEILWAALTIGRPSVNHVFQYGRASFYEAIFRLALVHMSLEQYGPSARRLRRTAAFVGLDPTEKGAVNYFLGMIFCKVFASRLLSTPWLMHLDVFGASYAASHGRSRPDLFGQQIGTGNWLAFETKGRASKPTANDRTKAKDQASRLLSVGGQTCALHVGTFSYFSSDVLNFQWIDPPGETKRPLNVPDVGDAWRYYYEPTRALLGDREQEISEREGGELVIPVDELDLKIRVHPRLAPSFLVRAWANAQRVMLAAGQELIAEGFQPDGLKVECGPSWPQRRSTAPKEV